MPVPESSDDADEGPGLLGRFWQRLVARVAGLGLIDRTLTMCLIVLATTVPFALWGFWNDADDHPILRPGWYDVGYAVTVATVLGWLILSIRLLAVRRTRDEDPVTFYAISLLYGVMSALFALATGWDTGPWVPLFYFGIAGGGFVWMDRPRETWVAMAAATVVLLTGIVGEQLGYIPHAWGLASSPNQGGEVPLWWHGLIGGQTISNCIIMFLLVRYIALRWRRSERAVAERNGLLQRMFGRYMSTEVMRTLLDNPAEALTLGGDRREVTLLMSGLRNFTALSAKLAPHDIIDLLNDYFEVMVDVCLDHQGTINEILGDSMLVVFGAPESCDDHADRAVACALAMQRAMETVNARNRVLGRPILEMGIGLNTGEVVVGNIGSSKRTKYGVVGSHVNRTGRIESYSAGGQVLASASVIAHARRGVEASPGVTMRPKGGEPIQLVTVRGVHDGSRPTPTVIRSTADAARDRWRGLEARVGALRHIDRVLVLYGITLATTAGTGLWAYRSDASTDPMFRDGWFQISYAFLWVCVALHTLMIAACLVLRRTKGDVALIGDLGGILYGFQNAMFALAIGWDTSPWVPLAIFGIACASFIWTHSPRSGWLALAASLTTLAAGITAEMLGWIPHAFLLAEAPNQAGAVEGWWHVIIGLQTLIVSWSVCFMIRYAVHRGHIHEAELASRNDLLRYMFGRYMSTEVMRALLEEPDEALGLGGQQREVTLVMTDLRGFTALAETLTPEQTIGLLNDYFDVMVDVCLEYGGTINEIIGDALLIVFGAPTPCDDHADRAVACAVAMQQAMDTVNARNKALGRPQLEMGIGVNTGEVVVGNVGSRKRTRYGVVGRQVNRTARIESYTVGGQVLVSQSVIDAARAPIGLRATHTVGVDVGQPFTLHVVESIGAPYGLTVPDISASMRTLDAPRALQIALLSGKHVSDMRLDARALALGDRTIRLEIARTVQVFDNLELILLSPVVRAIYGKVVEADASADARSTLCTVHLTSVPTEAKRRLLRWS